MIKRAIGAILDFMSDGLPTEKLFRERYLRGLTVAATPVPTGALPPLSYDTSLHVYRTGMVAWVKIDKPEPVIVLAKDSEGTYLGRLVTASDPAALAFASLRRARFLRGRTALDLTRAYRLPLDLTGRFARRADALKLEDWRVTEEEFAQIGPALGRPGD